MPATGDTAPDFTLPGFHGGEAHPFDLSEKTDDGNAVVLLFYPFDFSPVCSDELCALRDAEWFDMLQNVTVWAISTDSVYAHRAFAEQNGITFPLLSDTDGSVARAYGAQHEQLHGHQHVPNRAVFVVDEDRRIRYDWLADEPLVLPDFSPVKEALEIVASESDTIETGDVALDITYSETGEPLDTGL